MLEENLSPYLNTTKKLLSNFKCSLKDLEMERECHTPINSCYIAFDEINSLAQIFDHIPVTEFTESVKIKLKQLHLNEISIKDDLYEILHHCHDYVYESIYMLENENNKHKTKEMEDIKNILLARFNLYILTHIET